MRNFENRFSINPQDYPGIQREELLVPCAYLDDGNFEKSSIHWSKESKLRSKLDEEIVEKMYALEDFKLP